MSKIDAPQSQKPSPLAMVRALAGVAAFSGLLIVLVYQITLPTIKFKKKQALKKAIFEVLPAAKSMATFRLENNTVFVKTEKEVDKGVAVYAAYDNSGKLVGVAIEGSGQGYQEKLKILYGYDHEKETIVGMKVLESKETPGLGDKIETEPHFKKNFNQLDVKLTDDRSTLKNEIVAVKQGKKVNPWEVDGITGATISSKAVSRIINETSKRLLPIIHKNLSRLRGVKK